MNKKDEIQEELNINGLFKVVEQNGELSFYIDENLVTEFNGVNLKKVWEKYEKSNSQSVSAKQIRLGFLNEGIIESDILTEIEKLEKTEKDLLSINWKYSSEFEKNDPILIRIFELLNLTAKKSKDIWKKALAS